MKFFNICFLALFFIFSSDLFSQEFSNISIQGQVVDTSKNPVSGVTVMLLNSSDSTLVNFTTSNLKGQFSINRVRNSDYLLKLSHVSFMPRQIRIKKSDIQELDLGEIPMSPISEILMEVVVKAAQAPISFRGDTVEYDARLFKVPPGSTVEDLLKRLPGIEVDAGGNITSMGERVGRVYVDGNIFFSDDPTVVSRNLSSEAVSKVQVFNEKSEQERLTGIDDGSRNKVMNLELKEEYKKGYFGKASAAAGTENRWAGRGSFNRFDSSKQLSFIGYANNINETSLNWEDYSEFKGQSFSTRDNGDFGFGSRHSYGRFNLPGSYYDGRGLTKNYGAGVNYNYFKNKIKLNAGYFFNQTNLEYKQLSERQTFLSDTSFFQEEDLVFGNSRDNHNFNGRAEIEIDSSNTLIVRSSLGLSGNSVDKMQMLLYKTEDLVNLNENTISNITESDALSFNTLAIYNHKFRKKGRSFSFSTALDINRNNVLESLSSLNEYLYIVYPEEQIKFENKKLTDFTEIKSSLMYVEPITTRISIMSFYNFSSKTSISDKLASDELDSGNIIDSLSLFYTQNLYYNFIGASVNYNHQGINISVGGAGQLINQRGYYSVREDTPLLSDKLNRYYYNFIPNFSADIQLPSDIRLYGGYSYYFSEPDIAYLQPAPDLSNPLFRIEGNPDLNPESSNFMYTGAYYWNRSSLISVSLNANYQLFNERIVYNRITELVEGVGYATVAKPVNVIGGTRFNTNIWANFPIIKTKLTMRLSPRLSVDNTPVMINNEQSMTKVQTIALNSGLNLTIGPKLSLSIDGRFSDSEINYSLQQNQTEQLFNYSASAGIKWQFAPKTFLEANYSLSSYQHSRFDYQQDIHLLNVSIRQLLGEKNRFELRLAALDVLNQQQYIRQIATLNYTENIKANTLARYFLFGVSYNLKGFEDKNSSRAY